MVCVAGCLYLMPPLLFYIDQVTGFPLATNGGNIAPEWDNGPLKILSLV